LILEGVVRGVNYAQISLCWDRSDPDDDEGSGPGQARIGVARPVGRGDGAARWRCSAGRGSSGRVRDLAWWPNGRGAAELESVGRHRLACRAGSGREGDRSAVGCKPTARWAGPDGGSKRARAAPSVAGASPGFVYILDIDQSVTALPHLQERILCLVVCAASHADRPEDPGWFGPADATLLGWQLSPASPQPPPLPDP
jgi:hypothetical protein